MDQQGNSYFSRMESMPDPSDPSGSIPTIRLVSPRSGRRGPVPDHRRCRGLLRYEFGYGSDPVLIAIRSWLFTASIRTSAPPLRRNLHSFSARRGHGRGREVVSACSRAAMRYIVNSFSQALWPFDTLGIDELEATDPATGAIPRNGLPRLDLRNGGDWPNRRGRGGPISMLTC